MIPYSYFTDYFIKVFSDLFLKSTCNLVLIISLGCHIFLSFFSELTPKSLSSMIFIIFEEYFQTVPWFVNFWFVLMSGLKCLLFVCWQIGSLGCAPSGHHSGRHMCVSFVECELYSQIYDNIWYLSPFVMNEQALGEYLEAVKISCSQTFTKWFWQSLITLILISYYYYDG